MNTHRNEERAFDVQDAIREAVAERQETGCADETRFGFAATVANAAPPIDDHFRGRLRASIAAEAARSIGREKRARVIPDRGKDLKTGRPHPNLRLALGMSAAAVVLAFLFATPPGRTLAQSALRFFVPTERVTFPLQPSQMTTPDPASPTAQPAAPLISIAEAERQAGLDVAELPFIPDGFRYLGARVYGQAVRIEYEAEGGGGSLIIRQSPEGFVQSRWDEVPEQAIVPVKIGQLDGEFAQGAFVVYPEDTAATWDPDVPILRLRWVTDDIWFEMTKTGDVESIAYLDQAHLTKLAARMGSTRRWRTLIRHLLQRRLTPWPIG